MMTISVNIGERRPAYATGMGRVMLADLSADELERFLDTYPLHPILPSTITDAAAFREELARVRRNGYALVDQELEAGLVAVAVPVRDRLGRVRAAINLSTHIGRKSAEEMRGLVPALTAAARDIEVGLRSAPD
jgi:IclR family pca regulon transcriptional regulator